MTHEERLTQPQNLSPEEYRARIFSEKNMAVRRKTYTFFGLEVETRQPTVTELDELTTASAEVEKLDPDKKASVVLRVATMFSYIPGTDKKVFQPEDAYALTKMPFGPDMKAMFDAVNELTSITEDAAKNA